MMNTGSRSTNRNTRNGKPRHRAEHDLAAKPLCTPSSLQEGAHRGGVDEGHSSEIEPHPTASLSAQSFDVNGDVAAVGGVDLTGQRQHDGGWRTRAPATGVQA